MKTQRLPKPKKPKTIKFTLNIEIENEAGMHQFARAIGVLAEHGFEAEVKQFVKQFIGRAEAMGVTIPADLKERVDA